jgi:hypothetical protein
MSQRNCVGGMDWVCLTRDRSHWQTVANPESSDSATKPDLNVHTTRKTIIIC